MNKRLFAETLGWYEAMALMSAYAWTWLDKYAPAMARLDQAQ